MLVCKVGMGGNLFNGFDALSDAIVGCVVLPLEKLQWKLQWPIVLRSGGDKVHETGLLLGVLSGQGTKHRRNLNELSL